MTPQSSGGGCRITMEELDAHLLTGSPASEAHVRGCPECQARLAALGRLEALSAELFEEDVRAAGAGDQSWLEDVLANPSLESTAGRSMPPAGMPAPDGVLKTGRSGPKAPSFP